MHIPDGFINLPTSAGAGLVAAGGIGAVLKAASRSLAEKLVPFAGLTAAFIFVLQMLNFPVAAGTSGHLIGGGLAAVLLGPWLGALVVSIVVVVQALVFADGGITALGLNIVNMALLTVAVAWPTFRVVARLLPGRRGSVMVAAMTAAWVSVVASAAGFSLQYWLGGTAGVEPSTVLGAMVGVHTLIGIGEGLITATAVGAVLVARPDLVAGTQGLSISESTATVPSKSAVGGFAAVAVAASLALLVFVAPFASSSPDGLERVAEDTGFAETALDHPLGSPLADYGLAGVENEVLATIVSGLIGLGITFAAAVTLVGLRRRRAH